MKRRMHSKLLETSSSMSLKNTNILKRRNQRSESEDDNKKNQKNVNLSSKNQKSDKVFKRNQKRNKLFLKKSLKNVRSSKRSRKSDHKLLNHP